ncbi:MFS transporter [Amycolatopsis echigonensis]|uniref:MFS family arabinose efflux permease n=1 Tax=Amycolatopsis echigonensis TaxID=2576905 RepID=A0A2N3WMW7_9PSEU|nr:MFS transporter [Amycolatopsis echigonensis]PKV95211.1 putative MFS family arabinose efflux permease [Amycolatopsis niigatensis]
MAVSRQRFPLRAFYARPVHSDFLRGPIIWFVSLAAALGTAAIYPLQPAIAEVSGALGTSLGAVGVALACGPVGYLCGLALLVPLVDQFPPRCVLSVQFGALAIALGLNAIAGQVWVLGLVVGVLGACSSVGAGLSSVTARLASPNRRATALGIVTAGISAGILAGRVVGGWLADLIGWRAMLGVFAAGCAAVAVAVLLVLPPVAGAHNRGYFATLRSIPGLYLKYPALRLAAVRGALWFFAFCAVWSGIAVALSKPPFSYSAERIGLYAFAGIVGIFATRIAGAWTDRVGARRVILCGLGLAGVASAMLAIALPSTVSTVLCLALFDAGLFGAQVANQSTVLAIEPSAPARFNSAYMVVYFAGGSLGTAFGATAAEQLGWPLTALGTTAVIAGAAVLTLAYRTRVGAVSVPVK